VTPNVEELLGAFITPAEAPELLFGAFITPAEELALALESAQAVGVSANKQKQHNPTKKQLFFILFIFFSFLYFRFILIFEIKKIT